MPEILYKRAAKIMRDAIKDLKLTQPYVISECRRLYGVSMSQTTLSKMLDTEKVNFMSAANVSAICRLLKLNLNNVLSFDQDAEDEKDHTPKSITTDFFIQNIADDKTLLASPANSEFFAYVGNKYDIFFLTTRNKSKLIHGVMEFENYNDKKCLVHITVFEAENEKEPKRYSGEMLISLKQMACYCIVGSQEHSELWSIVFHHRYFSNDLLKTRMAVMVNVSSGESKRPVMSRLAICKQGLVKTQEHRDFIAAELRLNNSKIIIPESRFNQLLEDENWREVLTAVKERNIATEPHYVFIGNEIFMIPNIPYSTLTKTVALLQENSIAPRFNKIGAKADEMLYSYFFENDTE